MPGINSIKRGRSGSTIKLLGPCRRMHRYTLNKHEQSKSTHFNQINADKMWWPDSLLARFEMKSRFELWSRSPSSIIKQDTTLTDILLCQNTT